MPAPVDLDVYGGRLLAIMDYVGIKLEEELVIKFEFARRGCTAPVFWRIEETAVAGARWFGRDPNW